MPFPVAAAITGGAELASSIFSGKGANKSRDKQLAYAKEQDAYDRARQAEIDAAEKAQVAQQNAYASAHQTYVSDYNKWRMKYITGDTKEPPPTFNFDYNGMVPPSAPASRSSIGSLASDAPAPVQNALASPQMTPDTLGAIAQKTPWDWGSGDPRAARKVPSQTLSSLAGRY